MAEQVESILWGVEVQDEAGGPWRLMASEGSTDPEATVYAFRDQREAEETAALFRGGQRARVARFDRAGVTDG